MWNKLFRQFSSVASHHHRLTAAVLVQNRFLYNICTTAGTGLLATLSVATESELDCHPMRIKKVQDSSVYFISTESSPVGTDSALAQQHLGSKSSG